MTRRSVVLLLLTAVLAALLSSGLAHAQGGPPPPPHAFFGSVEVNGQPAPVGAVIEARGDNVLTGVPGNPITVIAAGKFGGPTINEAKLAAQGQLQEEQPIEFYVDGVKAQCARPGEAWQESYPYNSGVVTQLNLRVGSAQPPSEPSATPSPTLTAQPAATQASAGGPQTTATPKVGTQATAASTSAAGATVPAAATSAVSRPTAAAGAVVSKPTDAAPVAGISTAPVPSETQPAEQPTVAPVAAIEPVPTLARTVAASAVPTATATAAKVAAARADATTQPILEQTKPSDMAESTASQTSEGSSGRLLALWGGLGALLVAVALAVLIKNRGLLPPR